MVKKKISILESKPIISNLFKNEITFKPIFYICLPIQMAVNRCKMLNCYCYIAILETI